MNRRYIKVVIPTNADQLLALGNKILQKHYQDGSNSVIPNVLTELLQVKWDIVRNEQERRLDLERQKEKRNEEHRLIIGLKGAQNSYMAGTVRYFVLATRDILLGQFRGNNRMLGDWGYTVNSPKGKARIIIPTQADSIIKLAKAIVQKHYQDGSSSPLNALDWDLFVQLVNEAELKLEEGRKLDRDKEIATQARNIALGIDKGQTTKTSNTMKYLINSVRDVLLGVYRGRERELGNWGFEINTGGSKRISETTPSDTVSAE